MKKLILSLVLMCASVGALASTITLNTVGCSGNSNYVSCKNPSPTVQNIDFAIYQGLVTATVNGVAFSSLGKVYIYLDSTFPIQTVLFASDGRGITVDLLVSHWLTYTRTGRGTTITHHYALLGGTVEVN